MEAWEELRQSVKADFIAINEGKYVDLGRLLSKIGRLRATAPNGPALAVAGRAGSMLLAYMKDTPPEDRPKVLNEPFCRTGSSSGCSAGPQCW